MTAMRAVRLYLNPVSLMQFAAALLVCSIVFSPFLLSISMWLLVLAGLWQAGRTDMLAHNRAFSAVGMLRNLWGNWTSQPELLLLGLLFFTTAISGLWSEDLHFWWERTRVRIPFLVLPLTFASLPLLKLRQYQGILYLMIWVLFVTNIGVMINFSLHYADIMERLNHGQPMPVPRNHIRFSLMTATAVLTGGWLWYKRYVYQYKWERPLLGAAVLLMAVMLHVLAVRSGIAALYAALCFTIAWNVWRYKKWGLGLAGLGLMVLVGTLAVQFVPSLKKRLDYMRYDWEQYKKGAGDDYSDAERWISLEAGMALWRQAPWTGVGSGDLPVEIAAYVKQVHPRYVKDPRLPHNQFVYILAATGLLGMLASLVALLAPWFYGRHRSFYLFWVLQVIVFVSFLVEYTLETAIGVAFYLFYSLFFIHLGRAAAAETATTHPLDNNH